MSGARGTPPGDGPRYRDLVHAFHRSFLSDLRLKRAACTVDQDPMPRRRTKRVLATSSGGGHWVQLLRLSDAFAGCDVVYATVSAGYRQDVPDARFHVIPDATRWDKLKLVRLLLRLIWVLVRERPDVVVTTGAAPGYLAVVLGRVLGARTVWIDSIANVEEMSMSGQRARSHADLWLTQWPHLAVPGGPSFAGAVL